LNEGHDCCSELTKKLIEITLLECHNHKIVLSVIPVIESCTVGDSC